MASRFDIESSAFTLLKEAGVEDQYPVPLETVATYLGFKTHGFAPDEGDTITVKVSGLIDYGSKTIYVNTTESLARQRFTLAHEIGHAYLHRKTEGAVVDFRAEMDNPHEDKEREANQFAAALLMPREQFIRQWLQWKGDVEMLSTVFGASKEAVKVRGKNLLAA